MTGKGKRSKNISLSRNKRGKGMSKDRVEEQTDHSEKSQAESINQPSNGGNVYTGVKRRCPSSPEPHTFRQVSSEPAQKQFQDFDAKKGETPFLQANSSFSAKFKKTQRALRDSEMRDQASRSTKTDSGACSKEEKHCPICSIKFTPSKNTEFINEHVDHCLDSKPESSSPKEDNKDTPFEDELVFCQICQKDLSHMNSQRKTQHMNRCCDKEEQKQLRSTPSLSRVQSSQLACMICGKLFKSSQAQQKHLKKCAQQYGVSTNQVLLLVRKQQQPVNHPAVPVDTTSAGQLSVQQGAKKRRARTVKSRVRNIDEETQLAMALSASVVPTSNALVNKKSRSRRKDDGQELPALLLRTSEETRQVVAVRAAQVICPQEDRPDDDEEFISSTPALAPSKLAQNIQARTISEANMNTTDKSRRTSTTECQNEKQNGDKDDSSKCTALAAAGGTSSTVEHNSQTAVEKDNCCMKNQHTSVYGALSDSFISFIQKSEAVGVEPSKLPNSEVSDGPTPLWSLAALGNVSPGSQSFYVPRLLPKEHTQVSNKNGATHASVPSDTHLHTEPQQQPTVIHAAPDHTTLPEVSSDVGCHGVSSSQQTDVLLLAELAGSPDVRDTSVMSERDDGELPASGFCLPVGDAWKNIQQDASSAGAQCLLQELAGMLGDPKSSDITLVTKGNYQIPAHSFMLSLRSKTLAELLNPRHQPQHGRSWEPHPLDFPDTEPVVMETVLKFIYSGLVQVPVPWIDDVEELSQKLQLRDLAKACAQLKEKRPCHVTEEAVTDGGCCVGIQDLVGLMGNTDPNDESDAEKGDSEFWGGFDDEDIEEVRIFQTQQIKKGEDENPGAGEGEVAPEKEFCEGRDQSFVDYNAPNSHNATDGKENVTAYNMDISEEVRGGMIQNSCCPDQEQERGESPSAEQTSRSTAQSSCIEALNERKVSGSRSPCQQVESTVDCAPQCWSDGDLGGPVSSDEMESAFILVGNERSLNSPLGGDGADGPGDECDIQIFIRPAETSCIPNTPHCHTAHLASQSEASSSSVPVRKTKVDSRTACAPCEGLGESSGDDSFTDAHPDLSDAAEEFLSSLRERAYRASKKRGSKKGKSRRISPRLKMSSAAQSATPRGRACYVSVAESSPEVSSSPSDATLKHAVTKATPAPLHGEESRPLSGEPTIPSPSSPSESHRTPSPLSPYFPDWPQFSPTMFSSSPSLSPTIVRSSVATSTNQGQDEERNFDNDFAWVISHHSSNKSAKGAEQGGDFDVACPSSPMTMSPPVPSPRYSFLDTQLNLQPSPGSAKGNSSPPPGDACLSSPELPDEPCLLPVELVENQFEGRTESPSVPMDLEFHADPPSPAVVKPAKPEQKKPCAGNLLTTEEFCIETTGESKGMRNFLNLGLRERLQARQRGVSGKWPQTTADCSFDDDDASMSATCDRQVLANRSLSGRFEFSIDDDQIAQALEECDHVATTAIAKDAQSGVEFTDVGKHVSTEAGAAQMASRSKRGAQEGNKMREEVAGSRKKPRSQRPPSDSDEEQNRMETRAPKSKSVKEQDEFATGNGSGAAMTPMPHYNSMVTPELRKALQKYGVRALPKRKMVAKLTEIYQYTHRPLSEDTDDVDVPTVPDPLKTQAGLATVRTKVAREASGDCGETSISDGSESSDDQEFGDCTMEIAEDDVTSSQQTSSENSHDRLLNYIRDNEDLYTKILRYEPLELVSFQQQIKSDGINFALNKLVDFLDQQCITFTTANLRQRPRQRKRRGARKKDARANKM